MMRHVYMFILRAVTLSNPSLASKLYLPSFTSLFSFSLSLSALFALSYTCSRENNSIKKPSNFRNY